MSQAEIDYVSGLHEGYTGKVESWQHKTSGRGLGILTLPLLMKALGVVIVVKPLARDAVEQMPLPLEGQLELPLLGGSVNQLPKEHYWVRVAPVPKKPAKPLAKAGKGQPAQRAPAASRRPAAPLPAQRRPSGNGSKPSPRRASLAATSPAPC